MSAYPLIIIGGGLSGLAAGIRFARFGNRVLILEKHSKPGGLNSYYYRQGRLLETGLHAITNYAEPGEKQAPLNRLFRQLKISRRGFVTLQQFGSQVFFGNDLTLSFSNDFQELVAEIARLFPRAVDRFLALVAELDRFDPFVPRPRISAKKHLRTALGDELLVEMLLCPLMFYGSSEENDMDFSQFVIMFRALYQEGMFRPAGTIKDLLDQLLDQYRSFDGELRFRAGVAGILFTEETNPRVKGVLLESGETIGCNNLISTAGYPETLGLLPPELRPRATEGATVGRLSFVETINLLDRKAKPELITSDRTIIFYNLAERFEYARPAQAVDIRSGVICFPDNFHGLAETDTFQLRTTHLANYDLWAEAARAGKDGPYRRLKQEWDRKSQRIVGGIIGNYQENIVYQDSFTPVTVERYTSRVGGAIYGSPYKHKDGRTRFDNLFIAGTDQGYLGIIGSMLSGVTVVNQHLLR